MLGTSTKATTICSLATFKQWIGVTSNLTKTISALTSVGLVATAVCTGHGYKTGTFVVIAGAVQAPYNGFFLITVIDANTFTFPLPTTATSPSGGTPTVTVDDGRYALMADAATADFERAIDVPFVQRTITETRSGTGKGEFALDNNPVASITSFTIDGSAVDPTTYVLDTDTGIVTFISGSLSCGRMNCLITYVAGYDVQDGAALPADIVLGILNLAKAMHDLAVSNAIAASSVSLGPSSMVIVPSKRPATVQAVIDNWAGVGMRA